MTHLAHRDHDAGLRALPRVFGDDDDDLETPIYTRAQEPMQATPIDRGELPADDADLSDLESTPPPSVSAVHRRAPNLFLLAPSESDPAPPWASTSRDIAPSPWPRSAPRPAPVEPTRSGHHRARYAVACLLSMLAMSTVALFERPELRSRATSVARRAATSARTTATTFAARLALRESSRR